MKIEFLQEVLKVFAFQFDLATRIETVDSYRVGYRIYIEKTALNKRFGNDIFIEDKTRFDEAHRVIESVILNLLNTINKEKSESVVQINEPRMINF